MLFAFVAILGFICLLGCAYGVLYVIDFSILIIKKAKQKRKMPIIKVETIRSLTQEELVSGMYEPMRTSK